MKPKLTITDLKAIRYIHDNPGCTIQDVADSTERSKTTTYDRIRKLKARGILNDNPKGRVAALCVADGVFLARRMVFGGKALPALGRKAWKAWSWEEFERENSRHDEASS